MTNKKYLKLIINLYILYLDQSIILRKSRIKKIYIMKEFMMTYN